MLSLKEGHDNKGNHNRKLKMASKTSLRLPLDRHFGRMSVQAILDVPGVAGT